MQPIRLQLRRTKGFNLQEHSQAVNGLPCVKVDRSTRWGNPFKVGDVVHKGSLHSGRDETVKDASHACRLFRDWMFNRRSAIELGALRGKNLACWCPVGADCHADVLLELVNRGEAK